MASDKKGEIEKSKKEKVMIVNKRLTSKLTIVAEK